MNDLDTFKKTRQIASGIDKIRIAFNTSEPFLNFDKTTTEEIVPITKNGI